MLEEQLPKIAMIRKAIVTSRCLQDQPALLHDLRCGRHALYRLIQVLVQRVTAVGCDYDRVRPWTRNHRGRPRKGAALEMRGEHVSTEESGDLTLPVQRHI